MGGDGMSNKKLTQRLTAVLVIGLLLAGFGTTAAAQTLSIL